MMFERGVEVDHTTLFRWIQQYAPEIEKLPSDFQVKYFVE